MSREPFCTAGDIYEMKGAVNMGEKNCEAPINEFFTTEELREALRWYVELSDDVPVDMDVVLHMMEVVSKREQQEHPELYPDAEDALARFKERRKRLEVNNKVDTLDISTNQPTHMAAPGKPRRLGRGFVRVLLKVACAAAAMVMLFFCGIGVASAAGYDAWNTVASWTEDIFTFRDRGGNLKVSVPTSHEPDGSGSYASLQDALDAYGITAPIAPKWIPKGYNAESVTATTTDYGVKFSAIYTSPENQSETDIPKGIEVNVVFDESDIVTWHIQKDEGNPEVYEKNGVEHYIVTNTSDSIAVWQQGSCKCGVSSNGVGIKDLKMIIDSIYWRS